MDCVLNQVIVNCIACPVNIDNCCCCSTRVVEHSNQVCFFRLDINKDNVLSIHEFVVGYSALNKAPNEFWRARRVPCAAPS